LGSILQCFAWYSILWHPKNVLVPFYLIILAIVYYLFYIPFLPNFVTYSYKKKAWEDKMIKKIYVKVKGRERHLPDYCL